MIEGIIEEYIICEILNKISKLPLLTYKLCIDSSVKKNPFIVKYKEKDNKNKDILMAIKL